MAPTAPQTHTSLYTLTANAYWEQFACLTVERAFAQAERSCMRLYWTLSAQAMSRATPSPGRNVDVAQERHLSHSQEVLMKKTLSRALFLVGLLAANAAIAGRLSAEPTTVAWQKCDWICGQSGPVQGCEDAWFSSCGDDEYCDSKPTCGET